MKKYIIAGIFLLIAFLVGRASNTAKVEAQALAPSAWTIIGGGPVSTCSKPAGVTYICVGTDDVIGSKNGAAPVSLFPNPVVAGVIDVSVNGVVQTGHVVVPPIPTKATSSTTTTIQ